MRKIISTLLALCVTVSLVAGFTLSSNAETTEKRVITRVENAPTLDGKRDEIYDKGYQESLNIDTAGMAISEDEDFDTGEPMPKFTPASAEISVVWYSGLPDDLQITRPSQAMSDTLGGIYIFAAVTDCTRAWGVNNGAKGIVQSKWLDDPSAYETVAATPEFELSDSFWVFLDPLNYKSSRKIGISQFAFSAYCGFATGNGEIGVPAASWREYYYWGIDGGNVSGESGSGGVLETAIGAKVRSTVDYAFNEDYPLPAPLPENASAIEKFRYKSNLLNAYLNANINGYTLEMFLPWSATQMEIAGVSNLPAFLLPKVGTEFGMGFQLMDKWFSYWETNGYGTKPTYDQVHNYIYTNCNLLDYGGEEIDSWADVDLPVYYPTYVLGDYQKAEPEIIYGDVTGDGIVDIEDAMAIFYHVAKKELLTEEYQLKCADTNDDGNIDIADAMNVFYYVARKTDSVRP